MKTTKVFITPWISVMVTMSPLATCATSWPMTASTSSLVMFCSRPVDTATRAEFLKAPVAKALGSPSYSATSGMPIPALVEKLRTVPTIQRCVGSVESLMMTALVLHLAMGLLISSEMIAPPKPINKEKASNVPRFRPLEVRNLLTPNRLAVMPSTSITARLVRTNRTMRFMAQTALNAAGG